MSSTGLQGVRSQLVRSRFMRAMSERRRSGLRRFSVTAAVPELIAFVEQIDDIHAHFDVVSELASKTCP
ncbi:hypothetical protein MKW11_11785 [Gluconobacter frateurii]|uniref:hypothetical protein n=1 Tax=Gluconobacter frateurii TaxID=38308 RepID=UPI001F065B3B|nr:hypothetical protein [Gluconobacter frateurii]UMM07891.1 hypothetical protein MKW11_11785 [Gluconobacter frateurii]